MNYVVFFSNLIFSLFYLLFVIILYIIFIALTDFGKYSPVCVEFSVEIKCH